jgi:hypothetical protein
MALDNPRKCEIAGEFWDRCETRRRPTDFEVTSWFINGKRGRHHAVDLCRSRISAAHLADLRTLPCDAGEKGYDRITDRLVPRQRRVICAVIT